MEYPQLWKPETIIEWASALVPPTPLCGFKGFKDFEGF